MAFIVETKNGGVLTVVVIGTNVTEKDHLIVLGEEPLITSYTEHAYL